MHQSLWHARASVQVMFSSVIMLLLGGFAIAAALSKHFIAKAAAVSIMARVSRPRHVVLASMFIATFSSMWISNVAAPVLCFALVQPILRREHSSPMLGKVRSGQCLDLAQVPSYPLLSRTPSSLQHVVPPALPPMAFLQHTSKPQHESCSSVCTYSM